MKVLFLDFDGVLNKHGVSPEKPQWAKSWPFKWIEAKLVHQLDSIIDEHPNLEIVVSSTWRKHFSLGELKSVLHDHSIEAGKRIIGVTPDHTGDMRTSANRGDEIQAWLDKQPKNLVKTYAILDDDSGMLPAQQTHFVHINGYYGITEQDAQQVCQILSTKEYKPK